MRPFAQNPKGYYLNYFIRTSQTPESVENSIRTSLRNIDTKLVPDAMKTMDDVISDNIANERVIALLASCRCRCNAPPSSSSDRHVPSVEQNDP